MWDHELFLWLNFDGGATLDKIMLLISGKLTWIPLYMLLIFLLYRKLGLKSTIIAVAMIALAVGLGDIVSGVFKHSGLLKNLLPDFPVRLRPMHTPELADMVHFVKRGGQFGTVSGHAATTFALATCASLILRERWFAYVLFAEALLISYSRIYLGYHFPQDILLGMSTGIVVGVVAWLLYKLLNNRCLRCSAR